MHFSVLQYQRTRTIKTVRAYNNNALNTSNIIRRIIWILHKRGMYRDPSERRKLQCVSVQPVISGSVFPKRAVSTVEPKKAVGESRASSSAVRHNRATRLTHKAYNLNISHPRPSVEGICCRLWITIL